MVKCSFCSSNSHNASDSDSNSISPYTFSGTTKLLMVSCSSNKPRVEDYDLMHTKKDKVYAFRECLNLF